MSYAGDQRRREQKIAREAARLNPLVDKLASGRKGRMDALFVDLLGWLGDDGQARSRRYRQLSAGIRFLISRGAAGLA